MKEILSMIKANNEMGLLQSGHAYMMNRAASNHIEYLSYNELIKGIDFHLFINEIVEMDLELVLSKLEDLSKRLFTTEG